MSHESTPLLHRNSKAGDDASAALNHPTPLRTNKATYTPPPAILTSMVISIFPVVVNVATGLASTEPELEDVLKVLGASRRDVLWNVSLPRAMPYLFASLKIAITLAFVGTVLAETVAANRGIGNVMIIASGNFDVALVFSGLVILAALGVMLYLVSSWLESRVTGWAQRKGDMAMV
jgi:NitT/TauT family transport system permease protein